MSKPESTKSPARSMSKSTQQPVLFGDLFSKPVQVAFDAEALTSDAGLMLLSAADRKLGVTEALTDCVRDPRQQGKVQHGFGELLKQRVYGIGAAYEDCNDSARIRSDPSLKLSCGRGPLKGLDLGSQSTLSRFENQVTGREAVRMARSLEDIAVKTLKRRHRRASRIVIDLDPSVDPAHGAQQGVLFNGFYKTWCYLPIFGFLSVNGDSDHYLFHARLRPGTSQEIRGGVIPLLRRMVAKLRGAYGAGQYIQVRLDAGFANPTLITELEELGVKYVIGLPSNVKLKKWSDRKQPRVRRLARESGEAAREFHESSYAARSWPHERRVILKAEAIPYLGRELKNNPRFVVTNLRHKPGRVYEIYCGRGDAENRIKELKNDLAIDRTSCSSFLANQFRVLMTASAYMLFQELRWQLRDTELCRAQIGRIRDMLIKVGARVAESVRRVVFHFPVGLPFERPWRKVARALGAVATP